MDFSLVTGYGKQTLEAMKRSIESGGSDPELEAKVAKNTQDIASQATEIDTLDARVETAEDAITQLEQQGGLSFSVVNSKAANSNTDYATSTEGAVYALLVYSQPLTTFTGDIKVKYLSNKEMYFNIPETVADIKTIEISGVGNALTVTIGTSNGEQTRLVPNSRTAYPATTEKSYGLFANNLNPSGYTGVINIFTIK